MDLQLKGKRALITGGSRGIGKAVARMLLEEGARVVIAARTQDTLNQATEELASATKGEVYGLTVDTANDASVDAMVANAVAKLGGLDIVINGAARPGAAPEKPGIANLTSDFLMEELNVKLVGYVRVARAAAPHLVNAGWGRIINIGGIAARVTVGIVGSVRCVAVAAMTKNLAAELGPKGVNVTTVHPGPTRTEGSAAYLKKRAEKLGVSVEEALRSYAPTPLIGRIVDADELAAVVTFLASPRSVAINGDVIAAGGGTPESIHY